MTKVTRPLYGDTARGNIGDIGTFRMGRYGAEFIQLARGGGGHTAEQERLRECFRQAKAAHSAIPPTPDESGAHRVPPWTDFWRQWLIDHPGCK